MKESPLQLWIAIWQRQLARVLVVAAIWQVQAVMVWEVPLA